MSSSCIGGSLGDLSCSSGSRVGTSKVCGLLTSLD